MTAIQVAAIGAAVAAGRSSQRRKIADLQTELGVARTNEEGLRSQLQAALSELAAWQDGAEAADSGQNLDAEGRTDWKAAAAHAEQHIVERDQEIEDLRNRIASLECEQEAARQDEAEAADGGGNLDREEYARTIENMTNREVDLRRELESAREEFWIEQQGNELLERDLERAKADASKRVAEATTGVLHLHAEIIDLEVELDAAGKADQAQKSEIDRLSRRLAVAEEAATALAGAEERAKKAEDDGVDLLEQLEQAQQQAQKAGELNDELEGELAQTSTLVERANLARDQLVLEMKRQKAQHDEEFAEAREKRDEAREELRKAKEAHGVPDAMKEEMKEKDEKISRLEGIIDARDRDLAGKNKEVEKLNKRRAAAQQRADDEEQAATEARRELKDLQGQNEDRRKRVHDLTMRNRQLTGGVAARPPSTAVEPITGSGIREAVLGAVQLLGGVAIPESAMQHIEALDRESREGWREKVLGGLQALNEYATDRGDFPGNYYQWVQQGMGKDSAIGAKNVAMKDSETTAAAKSTSKARLFEIDPMVTGDSWMQMEAHLKFGTGTPNAPRIYFHDDTRGSTGKVHVGFIGPHSKVPTSGGF